jgi:hypothetical protein
MRRHLSFQTIFLSNFARFAAIAKWQRLCSDSQH